MFEISENTIVRKGMLFLYSSFHLIHKVGNFTLLKFQHNLYTFKSYQLKLYVQWQIEIYIKIDLTDNCCIIGRNEHPLQNRINSCNRLVK